MVGYIFWVFFFSLDFVNRVTIECYVSALEFTSRCKTLTNMKDMLCFRCSSLTSLDLSNFDTSNVTNMSNMFSECNGFNKSRCK